MPGSSKSSSSSSNTTQTTTQDNKVSATDNAIALGNEATFNYTDAFSPEVKEAFQELIGLARDAGLVAAGFAEKAVESNEKALDRVAERAKRAEEVENLKDQVLIKDVIPWVSATALGIVFFLSAKKKGKKK